MLDASLSIIAHVSSPRQIRKLFCRFPQAVALAVVVSETISILRTDLACTVFETQLWPLSQNSPQREWPFWAMLAASSPGSTC